MNIFYFLIFEKTRHRMVSSTLCFLHLSQLICSSSHSKIKQANGDLFIEICHCSIQLNQVDIQCFEILKKNLSYLKFLLFAFLIIVLECLA
jgi:hypothetical protein